MWAKCIAFGTHFWGWKLLNRPPREADGFDRSSPGPTRLRNYPGFFRFVARVIDWPVLGFDSPKHTVHSTVYSTVQYCIYCEWMNACSPIFNLYLYIKHRVLLMRLSWPLPRSRLSYPIGRSSNCVSTAECRILPCIDPLTASPVVQGFVN